MSPKETEWQRRKRRETERAAHVAEHGPACQICGNVPKRGLDQDHDHRTGRTRGWLCHRCNRALPTWVTVEWLEKAAAYLRGEPSHWHCPRCQTEWENGDEPRPLGIGAPRCPDDDWKLDRGRAA